jgi:hypothetical protein
MTTPKSDPWEMTIRFVNTQLWNSCGSAGILQAGNIIGSNF